MTTLTADLVERFLSPGLTDLGATSVGELAAAHDNLTPQSAGTDVGPR